MLHSLFNITLLLGILCDKGTTITLPINLHQIHPLPTIAVERLPQRSLPTLVVPPRMKVFPTPIRPKFEPLPTLVVPPRMKVFPTPIRPKFEPLPTLVVPPRMKVFPTPIRNPVPVPGGPGRYRVSTAPSVDILQWLRDTWVTLVAIFTVVIGTWLLWVLVYWLKYRRSIR
jgi:hypothetical protein